MSLKSRIEALESFHAQRRQAAAVDPARVREFFHNVWRAYGEPDSPEPEMSNEEVEIWAKHWNRDDLTEIISQVWQELDRDKIA